MGGSGCEASSPTACRRCCCALTADGNPSVAPPNSRMNSLRRIKNSRTPLTHAVEPVDETLASAEVLFGFCRFDKLGALAVLRTMLLCHGRNILPGNAHLRSAP